MRKHNLPFVACAMLAFVGLAGTSRPAQALDPYDPPVLFCGSSRTQFNIRVCGGPSGAPAGVTLQWESKATYDEFGWNAAPSSQQCALSLSGQPSLMHDGHSRWELEEGPPPECAEILIGSILFDETGVSGSACTFNDFECGTEYVFRAFAHAGRRMGRSDWSATLVCSTQPCAGCTFSYLYWKTHGPAPNCNASGNLNVWPVTSLTLGTNLYTDQMLCNSLNTPAGGNGLISLAHQLIAAKLNIADGAPSCQALDDAIANADALIGNQWVAPNQPQGFISPLLTNPLTLTLNSYNVGGLCSENCNSGAQLGRANRAPGNESNQNGRKATWGKVKNVYR